MEFSDKWKIKKIDEIANVVGGGTPKTNVEKYWNGNINWFTPSEIGTKKYIKTSKRKITESGLKNSSAHLIPKFSILLSSRATIGETSICLTETTTNQGFQSLIPKNSINNEFLYYLILTKKHELIRKSSGSTFLEISKKEIKQLNYEIAVLKQKEGKKE